MVSLCSALILAFVFAAGAHPVFQVDYPAPTADKPQSKLWYMDGSWWAVLPRAAGPSLWERTETGWVEHPEVVGALSGIPGRADVWPEDARVTAVALAEPTKSNRSMTVFRLAFGDDDVHATVLAEILPPTPDALMETATIVLDSTGTWWIAAVAGAAVCVWTSDDDGVTWSRPLVLEDDVNDDDICVVTPLAKNAIGVVWSDQKHDVVAMRVHSDGDALDVWDAEEIADSGGLTADDHLNTCVTPDGTLWVATKNSVDATGKPQFVLRKRTANGVWSNWGYGIRGETTRPSRPIVVANADGSVVLTGYGDNDRAVPAPHDARVVFHRVDEALPEKIGPPVIVIAPDPALKSGIQNVTGPRFPFPTGAPWIVLVSDGEGRVFEADLRESFFDRER